MAEITQSLEKQTAQGGDHATGSPCHPGSRALLLLLPCLLPIRDLSLTRLLSFFLLPAHRPPRPPQLPPSFLPIGTVRAKRPSALSPLSGKTPERCPLLTSLTPEFFPRTLS